MRKLSTEGENDHWEHLKVSISGDKTHFAWPPLPIIEKLTAPTIFIEFFGYIASGSGYPGGVGDEILLH